MEAAELALHLSQRIDAAFPGHTAGAAVLKATDALAEMVLALPGPPSVAVYRLHRNVFAPFAADMLGGRL